MPRKKKDLGPGIRWVTGGPELPTELLQSLEDGNLVLFCGAGISFPAGLPGFQGLVKQVYSRLNETMAEAEEKEFKASQYDRVLWLLEQRIGADLVRKAVTDILRLDDDANVGTHRPLLDLARTRKGFVRLVTTNFDRGFEIAARGSNVALDAAPKLPVPKPSSWNSVVHLHGRIWGGDPGGRSLVLTSADFGAAYLTDGWASRFLTELFRRFSVLFVGYSVNDPVIRYMLDAFAADRSAGDSAGRAYVLDGCTRSAMNRKSSLWKSKGLDPILYDSRRKHAALHRTLKAWASCHRRGLQGKESIVQQHAWKVPAKPFEENPDVLQVVWALQEASGSVARFFAKPDPAPPVEWLAVFNQVLPKLLRLDHVGGWEVPLVDRGLRTAHAPPLNPITRALGEWIVRHLDKPQALDWAISSGACLHPEFRKLIRDELKKNPQLPPALRTIWEILSGEPPLAAPWKDNARVFEIRERIKSGLWNLQIKHELIELFSPRLEFGRSFQLFLFPEDSPDPESIPDYAQVEVVPLCGDQARDLSDLIRCSPSILSDIAFEMTGILRKAMELLELVHRADATSDPTYSEQPSIADPPQNSGLSDWTVLIELCRDAWKELLKQDSERAKTLVELWKTIRYPIFRRLVFFAMAESDLYTPSECLAYLLEEDGWWLWSMYVAHEKFQLVKDIWPKLPNQDADMLISHILAGPPRRMFRSEVNDQEFNELSDRATWRLLAKLEARGRTLPEAGTRRLKELSEKYPGLRLPEDGRDEFPVYVESSHGEIEVENIREFVELDGEAVKARLCADPIPEDDAEKWRYLLSEQSEKASRLVCELAAGGQWPASPWRIALERLSLQKQLAEHWPPLAYALENAPDSLFDAIVVPLAWALREVASAAAKQGQELFWRIWDRTLTPALQHDEKQVSGQSVSDTALVKFERAHRQDEKQVTDFPFSAINSPTGHLTQALLDFISAIRPASRDDLSEDIWRRLATLLQGTTHAHTYARVILAPALPWFYRIHPSWTEAHLLPHFDWQKEEAPAVWQGFLVGPRITPELWPRLKPHFLSALRETDKLGKFADRACWLFAAISVDQPEWLTESEKREALRTMEASGRAAVAHALEQRMQGVGEKGHVLWAECFGPLIDRCWPTDKALRDSASSLHLATAATYAGEKFPEAVDTILPRLTFIENVDILLRRLEERAFASKAPKAVLKLLAAVIDADLHGGTATNIGPTWIGPSLRLLLDQIAEADPDLRHVTEYITLDEFERRRSS